MARELDYGSREDNDTAAYGADQRRASGDGRRPAVEPVSHRRPETKTFIATSEFWVMAIAAAAMLFAAYVLDDIRDADSWRYLSWIAIGYMVCRGLAKAGSQRAHDATWERTS